MVTDGTGVFMYFAKVIPTIYNPGKVRACARSPSAVEGRDHAGAG